MLSAQELAAMSDEQMREWARDKVASVLANDPDEGVRTMALAFGPSVESVERIVRAMKAKALQSQGEDQPCK